MVEVLALMGLFNLGAILSEATAALGNNLFITPSRASLYANKAHQFIWDTAPSHDRSEGLAVSSTTSGENKITLPAGFQEIINVSNLSASPPYPLTQWNSNDIDSNYTYQAAPRFYVRYNEWLELWPSPDSSYSIQLRFRTQPSTLTALTQTASFATRYDMAWLYKTVEYLADGVRDYDAAALYRQKFLSEMVTQPSDLALKQRAREGMRISMPHRPRGEQPMDSLTSVL